MSDAPTTAGWSCARCGKPESEAGRLEITRRSFRRPALLCPQCRALTHRRHGLLQWLLIAAPAVAGFTQPLWRTGAPESGLMIACGFWFGDILFVFAHELGHAVAGHFAGFKIVQVRLGFGALVASVRSAGIDWQLRWIPGGGLTFGLPRTPPASRAHTAAFILGGPMANLAGLLLAWWLWPSEDGEPRWWHVWQLHWIALLSNGWLLLLSLLPMRVRWMDGAVGNDAWLLWRLWWPEVGPSADPKLQPIYPIRRIGRWLAGGLASLAGMVAAILGWVAITRGQPLLLLGVVVLIALTVGLGLLARTLGRPRLGATREVAGAGARRDVELKVQAELLRLSTARLSETDLQELVLRVQTHTELGHAQDALAEVRTALARDPSAMWPRIQQAWLLTHSGDIAGADAAFAALDSDPAISDTLRVSLVIQHFVGLARAGRTEEARQLAARWTEHPFDPEALAFLLDGLASQPLLEAHGEFIAEADAWSARACESSDAPGVRVTRGGVLCELGRLDEAEAMLRPLLDHVTTNAEAGVTHLYLAVAAGQRGDRKLARHHAWLAFCFYPTRLLVERLASEGLASGS
jgi:tetratricopeptide (TPR) repeat protein